MLVIALPLVASASRPLRNEEFLGILANKRGSHIDAILGNENLKKILEEVIRLVDAEFEDSQQ